MAALGLALAVLDTLRRRQPAGTGPVAQAVVLTGQFYRIPPALDLLATGRVGRLFVSGVTPGSGLTPQSVVARFGTAAPWLPEALAEGRVELGLTATSTFDNAHETACWYRQAGLSGPLLLITSRAHMPRASVALEAALPGVEIRRAPIDGPRQSDGWAREFPAYLATRLVLLDPRQRHGACAP